MRMPRIRNTRANNLGPIAARARAFNFLSGVGSRANRAAAARGRNTALREITLNSSGSGGAGGGKDKSKRS